MTYQEPDYLPWDGRRVPLTFVGGYLGSGKTNLINEVLLAADRPIAVIVNDVGSLNIDAALIRSRHGNVIEVTGGCVCCSSIDGMGAAFDQLRASLQPPDHVLIELSGVAETQRMLPWGKSAGFMLDSVVVVVAADQLGPGAMPDWVQTHLAQQIRSADLLVLTKTDLVSSAVRHSASNQLTQLAPNTPVIVRDSSLDSTGAIGRMLSFGGSRLGIPMLLPPPTLFDAHQVQTVAMPEQLTLWELERWLDAFSEQVSGVIVRAKAIASTSDAGLVLIQIVGARREITPIPEPERDSPTDLVVITIPSHYLRTVRPS